MKTAAMFVLTMLSFCLRAQPPSSFAYKGIGRAVFTSSDLGTAADQTFVRFIQTTGANAVEINIEWFMPNATASSIAASPAQSPTDAQLVAAIQQYHNLGLKVALKPVVDTPTYVPWRATFAPSDVGAWFTSYQAYILHYAQIAQQNSVEILCTELKSLSGPANLPSWKSLIAAVRAVFTGTITYAANATIPGDEFTTVSFWNLVDLIGVDGYFGLTGHNDPPVSELVAAWTNSSDPLVGFGFNAVAALKNLSIQYRKPVIFTELGYESSAGANQQPYAPIRNGYDPSEQTNCYTAFFQVFSKETSWMKGVFWWDLNLPVPGPNDQSWSMYGKPAGTQVLPLWFGGATASTPAPH